MGRGGAAFGAVVAGLAFASPLLADDAPIETIRVEYQAPATCPGANAFTEQVFRRTRHARIAEEGERARVFVVRIAEQGKVRGVLELQDVDGVSSTRNLVGKTCDEVVAALALVTALALDPSASTAPVASLPPASTEEAASDAGPSSAEPADAASDVDAARALSPPSAPPPVSPPAADVVDRPRPRLSAALEVEARAGLFREVGALGGARVGVELDRPGRVLSPELRLAFSLALPEDVATSLGSARFSFVAGRLDACPLRLRPVAAVDVRPCAAIEVGELGAEGIDIPDAQRSARAWVALAPLLRGRARPGPGALFFELEAGMPVALVRDRYVVTPPGATIYRAPPVGASGALGVGWEIW